MRTTVDIPRDLLTELMALSGARKKKDAVRMAVEEFVRRRKLAELLEMPGKLDLRDVSRELEEAELDELGGAH